MPQKPREKGESYRPKVVVLKESKGVPTRIEFGGNEYFMINPEQDRKNHFNNARSRRNQRRKSERAENNKSERKIL